MPRFEQRPSGAYMLCLPFATAPPGADCARGHTNLMRGDLQKEYEGVDTLEVHTFTDLNIFLSTNPFYKDLLASAPPPPLPPGRRPAQPRASGAHREESADDGDSTQPI